MRVKNNFQFLQCKLDRYFLDYAVKCDRVLQLQAEGIEYNASLYYGSSRSHITSDLYVSRSVLGMLPLAVLPGKGAELYQGLSIALTGGLALYFRAVRQLFPQEMGLLRDFQPRRSKQEQELKQEKAMELMKDKS